MTKILLLENPHEVADTVFSDANVQVDRIDGALDENDLIKALQGYQMVGIRSKTNLSKRVFDECPDLVCAGTFTIGTYEIPKQYVCAKTPTITQKNDICEIVTYDQQITVNGHNYAPVLHQNCMQPEQITLYPLVIRQEHATLTVSDRYHTGHWKSGDDTQISDWRPKLMHRGCVPCTNCGRC